MTYSVCVCVCVCARMCVCVCAHARACLFPHLISPIHDVRSWYFTLVDLLHLTIMDKAYKLHSCSLHDFFNSLWLYRSRLCQNIFLRILISINLNVCFPLRGTDEISHPQNKYIYSSHSLNNQTLLHFRKKSIFNILHLCNELKICQSFPRLNLQKAHFR